MPNKLRRDKRGGSRNSATRVSKPPRAPDSVKEVLARAAATLTRVADQTSRQNHWKIWLAQHVSTQLTAHLSGIVEREDTLILFADSAVWSARLRYVIQELEPQIKQAHPTIQHVSIRVMPRT